MKKPKGFDEYQKELERRNKRVRTIFCEKCKKEYKEKDYEFWPIMENGFLEMWGLICPKRHRFQIDK